MNRSWSIRALQISAVLLLVGVLVAVRYGLDTFFHWTSPQFVAGFLVGGLFFCGWFLILKLFGLKLD